MSAMHLHVPRKTISHSYTYRLVPYHQAHVCDSLQVFEALNVPRKIGSHAYTSKSHGFEILKIHALATVYTVSNKVKSKMKFDWSTTET